MPMLTHASIEKLAASIVAGMIREAAYRGDQVSAREIASTIAADPEGETATYFRRSVVDALDIMGKMQANPELLDLFGCAA